MASWSLPVRRIQGQHRSLHGLSRSLLNNMVAGRDHGLSKRTWRSSGVGYQASWKGRTWSLQPWASATRSRIEPPDGIAFARRDPDPVWRLSGSTRNWSGEVAARIRATRPPEPYKGKGVQVRGRGAAPQGGQGQQDREPRSDRPIEGDDDHRRGDQERAGTSATSGSASTWQGTTERPRLASSAACNTSMRSWWMTAPAIRWWRPRVVRRSLRRGGERQPRLEHATIVGELVASARRIAGA